MKKLIIGALCLAASTAYITPAFAEDILIGSPNCNIDKDYYSANFVEACLKMQNV